MDWRMGARTLADEQCNNDKRENDGRGRSEQIKRQWNGQIIALAEAVRIRRRNEPTVRRDRSERRDNGDPRADAASRRAAMPGLVPGIHV